MLIRNQLKTADGFTETEKRIAEYILTHPAHVTECTCDELAAETYSSPSAVVRLAKKLGCKGYAGFKIQLASELHALPDTNERIETDMPIHEDSSPEETAMNLMRLYRQTVKETAASIDLDKLTEMADVLYQSDQIVLRGIGSSNVNMQSFYYNVQRIGLPAELAVTEGFGDFIVPNCNAKNPVLFILSTYASSIQVRNMTMTGHRWDMPVMLLTANPKSPLLKLARWVYIIDTVDEPSRVKKLGPIASRVAENYILDILYALLFEKDYKKNMDRLERFRVGRKSFQTDIAVSAARLKKK